MELPVAVPTGASELRTETWRFWLFAPAAPADPQLVYLTATPENYEHICTLVAALLAEAEPFRPAAVRLAANREILGTLNSLPEWAGKAVTFIMDDLSKVQVLAQQVDALVSGRGFQGPPVLRARPYGGRAGLVFLQTGPGLQAPASAGPRPGKLASLLGNRS
jgi:hypothetical protein